MKTTANFRDLGGIRGHGGKIIKPNRLYRGGQLFGMTDAEKAAFCTHYDIRTIIDLRNEESCIKEPNGDIPGVTQYVFEVMLNMQELSNQNPLRNTDPEEARAYMRAVYRAFATNRHACNCFKNVMELIAAQRDGALYFHCFAGKDRTGVAAAILLYLLGAGRQDILADYLETLTGRREDNERLIAIAKEAGAGPEQIEVLHVYYNVEWQYLESFVEAAENAYGSFQQYLAKGVGIGEETVHALRANYLE